MDGCGEAKEKAASSIETAITVTIEGLDVEVLRRLEFQPFCGRVHAEVSRTSPPSRKSRATDSKGQVKDTISQPTLMEHGDSLKSLIYGLASARTLLNKLDRGGRDTGSDLTTRSTISFI